MAAALGTSCAHKPEPVSLTLLNWNSGQGFEVDTAIVAGFTERTGIAVKQIPGAENVTSQLGHTLQFLNRGATEPDVMEVDVIWPGILAGGLIDLNPYAATDARAHTAALVANDTVGGRLVAMPSNLEIGVLYYRTDLLRKYGYTAPPSTWDELETMSRMIQAGERRRGKKEFWGYVWQGAELEGLTCDALEWQVSHGGGNIIESDGTISVDNPNTVRAFRRAARWVGTISPPTVTSYAEEDSRNVFDIGNAAFMRNWTYAYALAQRPESAVRGNFDVTELPSGGARHAGTLGGWQLGVSKYSTHVKEAVELVRFLTSQDVETRRSRVASLLPTIAAAYGDEGVRKRNPYMTWLKDRMPSLVVARPSTITGAKYGEVSKAYYRTVHAILTKKVDAADGVSMLAKELRQITGFP